MATVTLMMAASTVFAQSPSPSPTAFPWPTLPSWYEVPVGEPFRPDGPADASVTAHGVRMELCLPSPGVVPGAWVQALVRATNTRTDDVWFWPGGCSAGTLVRVDLSSVIPMGGVQTGNAGVFKGTVIAGADVLRQTFDDYDDVVSDQPSGAWVEPLAECTSPGDVRRLRPGATRMERFTWYAVAHRAGRSQPLPAGDVTVSVLWPYVAHGRKPRIDWTHQPRHDISVSAPLTLTGDGPGTPSMPELIDTALADARFRAWVEPDPAPTDNEVGLGSWGYTTVASPPRWATIGDRAPDGFVEVSLGRDVAIAGHHLGAAILDAWTGELIDVVFE